MDSMFELMTGLVFTKFMPYLVPIVALILVFWVADEIIALLYRIFGESNRRSRGEY